MDSIVIPRPPPLGSTSGFRLLDQDETGSVYSVYKQKIDAMFESDSSTTTKNSVQARIERMFTDVAIDNGIPVNDIGVHNFSVDYLGSVPLLEKVTSLAGLQKPLRDLYFAYKRNSKHKKALTGRLEISASGLKVQYQGEKGDLEQLNSFPTIAVWSAVKFVLNEESKSSYAFLPLITDPDNIDKQQLFKALDGAERKYIGPDAHSPLFAVVMRKIGVHKQLECHGFVCQTSEDAIVIAATLYKSLMAHMKAKEKKPKNRNGVTCMSISSTVNEPNVQQPVRPPRKKRSTSSSVISDIETIDTETAPLIRPNPKKSTKTKRAPKVPQGPQDLDEILPYEEPAKLVPDGVPPALGDKWNTYKSNNQKQITEEIKLVMSESSNMGLKRVKSVRRRSEEAPPAKENSGDILTKVTIPRSGSFLNAGGLTRYKSKVQRLNGQATGGSPLGFNELFNEFRLQEGLHSMDEILGVIIDPEGMSFNDLKPIYKEFLLKLAVTLTKDELYQRSKMIMRRQKKKLLRRNSSVKKRSVMVCSKLKRLKHVFQRMRAARTEEERKELEVKIVESEISSSYNSGQFEPKEKVQVRRKMSYRKRDDGRRERNSTSEESDFFSLRKAKTKKEIPASHNRNSSSGYVSCSECSFDSDTCTCVSADKCYCSLPQKPKTPQKFPPRQSKCFCDDTLTFCGCDTDSCTDSNKCYCNPSTTFQHLKHLGFIPAQQTNVVTPPSSRKLCKKNSNTKSTRSLEYMHNPSEKYYERVGRRREDSRMDDARYCRDSVRSRLNDRNISKSSLPAGSEALAVKKSAEIAALFADIKLSQTTDVGQIRGLPRFPPSGRIISNSLYSSKNLYSATNGLYTIQSQSDDSSQDKRDYFNVKKTSKAISQGALENSLGYLP